ncbi:MAG: efflux RND transporter periplasmic adaptor subunit [Cypionkella sp.]
MTAEVRIPAVNAVEAVQGPVEAQVPVSGTLIARNEVLIYPQVAGLILTDLLVDVGDEVQAGQALAKIDPRTLTSQLAQAEASEQSATAAVRQAENQIQSAKASLAQAEAALVRAQSLSRSGNVSGAGLDTAVADAGTARAAAASADDGLAVAKAALRQTAAQTDIARLNLSNAVIVAPVSGVIAARAAQAGSITSLAGDPLFRIIEGGKIEVEAEVIETALGQIAVGDAVQLNIAGVGQIAGRVRLISPTVNAANRLGLVWIETTGPAKLRIGTFASGVITTDQHEGLMVPAMAVQVSGDKTYVLQVIDGVLHQRDVTAGLIWKDRREILSGLSEGDVVVSRASAFFADGDHVDAILAAAVAGTDQ